MSDADRLRLVGVCTSIAELFAANKVTVWSYDTPAGAATTGTVSYCAGATWDGRELSLDHRWLSVAVTELPSFAGAIARGEQISFEQGQRTGGRQKELMSALESVSFDCEPIVHSGRTVGVLMVDPPRVLETERAILLPVILEEAAFVLSNLETGRYREEARFLLTLLGHATARRSLEHAVGTACEQLARRLSCRHATVFLPDGSRLRPLVSKRPNGTRDLKSWKDFDALEGELSGYLQAWAASEVPLEAAATGWWQNPFGASGLLGAPIRVGGAASGVLLVDTDAHHEFTQSETYLVFEVAQLLGWLVPWSAAAPGAAEGSGWLLGETATEERTSDDVIADVCATAARLFSVKMALPVPAGVHPASGVPSLPPVQQSFATGEVASLDDVTVRYGSDRAPALRSVLAIPLGTGGQPWYVVACGDPDLPRAWSEDDLHTARHLALEGSLRLEVARLARVDRHQMRSLAQKLLRDPLTNLPNSVLLADRIEQALHRAQRDKAPLALLAVDIEGLRDVNNSLGSERGDMLLAQAAERLSASLRVSDVVARVGGDEFAVLLTTSATPEGTAIVTSKIQRVLSLPFNLGGDVVIVTANIGIARWPDHGDDPGVLLGTALEEMRRSGALRVPPPPGPPPVLAQPAPAVPPVPGPPPAGLYAPPSSPPYVPAVPGAPASGVPAALADHGTGAAAGRIPPHVALQDLPAAIDKGELVLHYLPKVSLSDGDVVSMEALVRWNHPEFGLVSPGGFLPLTDDTELGWRVTNWVLDSAMDQCRQWLASGLSLAVTVNVSRYDVTVAPLIDTVMDVLARTRLLGRHLTLEISEQSVMDELVRGSAALVILRSEGVRISIDDCGSGKVAPLYLARMPVDEIKIDNSLLTEGDPADIELVRDIVRLGHDFGIQITAEAVEGYDRAGGMERLGIDNIQGYHVAGPLLAENVPVWVANHRTRTNNQHSVLWTG